MVSERAPEATAALGLRDKRRIARRRGRRRRHAMLRFWCRPRDGVARRGCRGTRGRGRFTRRRRGIGAMGRLRRGPAADRGDIGWRRRRCREPRIGTVGLVRTDGDGVDLLRLTADHAAAEHRSRRRAGCGAHLILRKHAGGLALDIDRLLFARDDLLALGGHALLDQLGVRIVFRRHDLARRGIGLDHRRRTRRRGAEQRPIAEGARASRSRPARKQRL